MASNDVVAQFPDKLRFLFEPWRYKVVKGGRGKGASWGIARALLIQGAQQPLRIPCCREFQASIADSVHELLDNQIAMLGLGGFYKVTDTYIEGRNGTLFTYHGLKHNVKSIKSLEGADRCWVAEAQTVSKTSWNILIPTIRKDGSEIWVDYNPELESDETHQRYAIRPPTNSRVVHMTFRDNPWFPDVLRQEMEDLKARDEDEYNHVWEGTTKATLTGAVYAKEIRAAMAEGRITRVPYDPAYPVHVIFDLGRSDLTAMWFLQIVGYEFRFIDYEEDSGYAFSHYLKVLSEKPYHWGTWWLPHDADHDVIAAEQSVFQQAKTAHKDVQIVPHLGPKAVYLGIEAVRNLFPRCVFDEDKCSDGLHALKHYVYRVDETRGTRSDEPKHDWASHGSDALRYAAIAVKERPKVPAPKKVRESAYRGDGGWMA